MSFECLYPVVSTVISIYRMGSRLNFFYCGPRGKDLTWLIRVLQFGHLRGNEFGALLLRAFALYFFSSWQFLQFFKVILPHEDDFSCNTSPEYRCSLSYVIILAAATTGTLHMHRSLIFARLPDIYFSKNPSLQKSPTSMEISLKLDCQYV